MYLFKDINPFTNNSILKNWFEDKLKKSNNIVIDPFAGTNSFLNNINEVFVNAKTFGYDIHPRTNLVMQRDTLKDFPLGFNLAIANPPYLSKNESLKENKTFHSSCLECDDIAYCAINKILSNTKYSAIFLADYLIDETKFLYKPELIIKLKEKLWEDKINSISVLLFSN